MSEQNEKLVEKLIEREDLEAWRDAYSLCLDMIDEGTQEVLGVNGALLVENHDMENVKKALDYGRQIRKKLIRRLKAGDEECEWLYWRLMLMASRWDFDCFCRYIEKDREPTKKFYEPRRAQLYPLAMDMQRLEDNELDLLAISMPPGTGN